MGKQEEALGGDFFRFPHTPHLAWLASGKPKGDKVLSTADAHALLSGTVVVEEKLDGANLGISVDPTGGLHLQSRGEYLVPPLSGQFSRASAWLGQHGYAMETGLAPHLILFGEWCAARHSVGYDHLPDWFLAFDVYDRTTRGFWSASRRIELIETLGLTSVPRLMNKRTNPQELAELVMTAASECGAPHLEGVVIRRDGPNRLDLRTKLVRPDFTQTIGEHWRSRRIEWNAVDP